ncbi:MAG TPA: VirB8/TrbF family protein [Vicinamibacterales bacterium]|jgi:type IV secretion system protein VirB5|nr:VirB8/TrbF family protein [Vicinamibacterales bacterium]
MSETMWMPPPAKDVHAARRQFVELYGSTAVMNTYLKIAVLALCGVCVTLAWLTVRTYQLFHNVKPLVVRINELGRAEAVNYQSFEYRPQEQEIKYFLSEFVQRHYSRMRATVRENYTRSLYFLDGRIADAVIEANKKNKTLETFLAGDGDEIEVTVKNVAIEDLRQAPYRATVDFEKVHYGAGDHTERKREKYVAHFVFVVKSPVPNEMIPINPLGLTITYFREDQAFN